jgi:hypothetical protein
MSNFVNGATHALNWNGFCFQDVRLNRMDFQPILEMADIWAIVPASYANDWWPGGASMFGDPAVDPTFFSEVKWGEFDQAAGASSRYGLTGYTRDALGTIVAGCTVKLFRTSDDLLLDTTVSDPTGLFLLNTAYYPDYHYIVAHKSGSPDIDGVSVNTLIGV